MIFRILHCAVVLCAASLAATSANAAVEISSKPTQNMSCTGGICTPTAKKAVLNVADLAAMLASGDATIKSTNANPDIEIDAALSWTSTSRLTLDAYRSIAFNKNLTTEGLSGITIATNDGGSGGDYRFLGKAHIKFQNLKSGLVINEKQYFLVRTLRDLYRDIHRKRDGNYALAKSIDAIGTTYFFSPVHELFEGNFDGLGNTISNLTIVDSADSNPVGLFQQYDTNDAGSTNAIRDIGMISANIHITGFTQSAGVLVGSLGFGTVKNSYATGQVTGNSESIGGLIGNSTNGTVKNSHASVAVSGTADAVGGLIGISSTGCSPTCFGILENSYATGSVTGGNGAFIGGLVGKNVGGPIANSYATGAVAGGNDATAGGLVGANIFENPALPTIQSSYSTGAVAGGSNAVIGGFIGQDWTTPGISSSCWDLDTSGISDPSQGAGNIANDPGIAGLTTEQFKSGLPAGFNASIWKEKATINNGYPYLVANPPQ